MDREETKQMLKILSIAYPKAYQGYSAQKQIETVDFYHVLFGEYDTGVVVSALYNYVKSNQYPPTPAGIQAQIDILVSTGDTAIELWNVLHKAITNGFYGYREEFEKLPKPCKTWLGVPEQLRELAQMDEATVNGVTRGQFLKTIKDVTDRERAKENIPQSLADKLNGAHKLLDE